MNKDVIGTTDAGAPEYTAPTTTPAPADVVELTEHYETDSELADLALELVNRAIFTPECEEQADASGLALHRAWHTQRQAPLPILLLISRAMMRSAAAHERMAAGNEHSRRAEQERRTIVDEINRLQLENLQLQNRAFRGHVDRLDALAQYAVSFAQDVVAGRLAGSTDPAADLAEFAKALLRLSGADDTAAPAAAEQGARV